MSYSEAIRLGKPPALGVAGGQVKPRPLLIRFEAVQQKYELLQQLMALHAQQVNPDDDLTPFQRGLRAKLSTVFEMLKNYKRPRFWRQERLFTVHDGKLVHCNLHTVAPGCLAP